VPGKSRYRTSDVRELHFSGNGINQALARGAAGFVVNLTPKPVGDGLYE
jgi:hypothetical protein